MKQMMMAAMMCMMLAGLCACPDEGQGDADGESDAAGDEIKAGNEPNNTVFWHNVICEDDEYVYVSSYYDVQGKDINPGIVKIGKSDGSVTEMGARGNGLSIYDGYLYFLDDDRALRKMALGDPDAVPEPMADTFIYKYMILNGKIYPSGMPNSILSMNLDGSDREGVERDDKNPFAPKNYYVVYGHDDKYIYVVYPYESETEVVDGKEICVQYLYRMDYSHENKEKVFEVRNDVSSCFDVMNHSMMISGGCVYYRVQYDGEWRLMRTPLTASPAGEAIYSDETLFRIMAVTDGWIYVRQYIMEDSGSYTFKVYKLSPDGKARIEIDFKKDDDVPFFVGRFDQKLYYVEGNKIFPFD